MNVVDGMHRLRAAHLLGLEEVSVRFIDGSADDAFILAVEANVRHGLPLTLADRRHAAARVLAIHPDWSDRRVATSTGLAPGTIAAIRRRATAQHEQSTTRVGRDNRRRSAPLLVKTTRTDQKPQLSVVATSRSSDDSLPLATLPSHMGGAPPGRLLATLCNDPSVRLSARGRAALHVLTANNLTPDQWMRLPDAVPTHQTSALAQLAEHYAWRWHELARQLREVPREA